MYHLASLHVIFVKSSSMYTYLDLERCNAWVCHLNYFFGHKSTDCFNQDLSVQVKQFEKSIIKYVYPYAGIRVKKQIMKT